MRISDWSSDVCSSDLDEALRARRRPPATDGRSRGSFPAGRLHLRPPRRGVAADAGPGRRSPRHPPHRRRLSHRQRLSRQGPCKLRLQPPEPRSEEHTTELQSLMRSTYAVFCLKPKKQTTNNTTTLRRLIPIKK